MRNLVRRIVLWAVPELAPATRTVGARRPPDVITYVVGDPFDTERN